MIPYREITIDLVPRLLPPEPLLSASQYDNGRPVKVHVQYDGTDFSLGSGVTAKIQVRKPSGKVVIADAQVSTGTNVITFNLLTQMTAEYGLIPMELSLTGDGQEPIGTANWTAYIEKSPASGSPSDTWVQDLDEKVQQAVEAAEDAEQNALDAEAWAVGQRNGEDVPDVDPTYENNAKYYALSSISAKEAAEAAASAAAESAGSAADSATDASGSAESASGSASASAGSAAQAAGSATAAASSASAASTSAGAAAQSATESAGYATASENSAGVSAGAAEAAGQSATAAAGSASTAATYASNASASATASAGSATQSANSATASATSAGQAAGSATAAAGSATEADASADRAQEILDNIPEDYSELSDDVADLKSALSFAADVESVGITVKNKYLSIVNNHIDVNNPKTSVTGYGYTIVPCVAGDVFTVSGVSSGTEPMAWAFTDSTYTILSKAPASRTITDERITAPQNTAYLVIHDKSPYRISYKGIRDAAAEKLNAFTSIPFAFADQRIDASGNLVGAQNFHASDFYPCKEGEKIEFYGVSFYYQGSVAMRIISFYDESYSVLSHIDQIDGKATTVTEIGYITAVAPNGAKYVRISTGNRPEYYAHLYDIWDIVNNHAGLIRAGYSCAGDMLKKSVFAEEITDAEHRLLYRQGFCIYDGKYYSVEEGHIGVQDVTFATVGNYAVSIGHGNSIQVGSSNIAYINGTTDHKVYCVNLDTGEVTDIINLPFNSGAESAVIDDINNIAYILHTDLISASTPASFVLVAYDIEGAQVISTKPLPFKILQFQAVDFYDGKIILFSGTVGSNDDRLYVIDLSGSAIGKSELNLFVTNDEPEGVFYDRDKGDLYVSGYSGKLYRLVN